VDAHAKLWVERNGKIVLGDFRVKLLRLIDEEGSLREAAARLNISYRQAWGKVREIETNLGVRLVDSEIGGAGGGRSQLTEDARRLVAQYERFSATMDRHLETEFPRHFRD
jgi:molybdate transport system regulatory protein